MLIGEEALAQELQSSLSATVNSVKNSIPKIWQESHTLTTTTARGDQVKFGPDATTADIVAGCSTAGGYAPDFSILGKNEEQFYLIAYTDESATMFVIHIFVFQSPIFVTRPCSSSKKSGNWSMFTKLIVIALKDEGFV